MKRATLILIEIAIVVLAVGCLISPEPEPEPAEIIEVLFGYDFSTEDGGAVVDPVISIVSTPPFGEGWDDTEVLFIFVHVANWGIDTEYQLSTEFFPTGGIVWPNYPNPIEMYTGRQTLYGGWGVHHFYGSDTSGPGHWVVTAWLDGYDAVNYQETLFITPYMSPKLN